MDDKKTSIITKLLAKAERAGTEAESETFYAKAQELMIKWSIDEQMLAAARSADSGGRVAIGNKRIEFPKSKIWKNHATLCWAIARACEVKAVLFDYKAAGIKPNMLLVGTETDLQTVEFLYTSMLIQCSRERNRLVPEEVKANESMRGPWFRSFIDSYAFRIETRIRESKRVVEETAATEYGSSLLPVLANTRTLVEEEMRKLVPRTTTAKASRARTSADGAARGREAADRADIGQKRAGAGPRKELN